MHLEKNATSFLKSIIQNIIMQGACCMCLRCKTGIDEQTCFLCGETKDKGHFVKIQNKDFSVTWRCFGCAHPVCSNTMCAGSSFAVESQSPLPEYLLPTTKEEKAAFRCLACREPWECRTCKPKKSHLQTNFSEGERKTNMNTGTNQNALTACILSVQTHPAKLVRCAEMKSA